MIRSLGRGGCGCPPHSPSSPEILALLPSLSFSFDPCCPCLQEYIRRQLEEEQRQLEILQQQLLQEQALLLVNGRPWPRLPLSARVASACTHVPPEPPDVPRRGGHRCHHPTWSLLSSSVAAACLDAPFCWGLGPLVVHGSLCVPSAVLVCVCPRERSSPGCCCELLEAVCSMLGCVRAVACLHPSNPPCHAVLHVLSEGFCFNFLAGTLSIPLCAVCILDVLFFI